MLRLILRVSLAMSTILVFGSAYSSPYEPGPVVPPPLDNGWTRLFISAGTAHGPVAINDRDIGHATDDEYFVVDVLPGTYSVACTPDKPTGNLTEKSNLTIKGGETHFLACDGGPYKVDWVAMVVPGGAIGGAIIGSIEYAARGPDKYNTKTHIAERPERKKHRKVVAYTKLEPIEAVAAVTNGG